MAAFFAWRLVPVDTSLPSETAGRPWRQRLRDTLQHRGPWLVALSFACYSSQWLAVVGFLPEIYAAAQVSATWIAPLTALAAAVNMIGNIAAGRCLAGGLAAHHLLWTGFGAMGLGAVLAFVPAAPLGPEARYLAILVFSAVGGLVPGTLFTLAVRLAPSTDTIATTVGWTQQLSALGQLIGPPLVAWIAAQAGGWQWTGVLAALASAAGVVIAIRLAQVRPMR